MEAFLEVKDQEEAPKESMAIQKVKALETFRGIGAFQGKRQKATNQGMRLPCLWSNSYVWELNSDAGSALWIQSLTWIWFGAFS